MPFGSAFKSAWNGATSQARQKAAEIATGAKRVGAQVREQAQMTADKAVAAAKWAADTTAKAAGGAARQLQKAGAAVADKAKAARDAAAVKAAAVRQQARQRAASLARKAKQAFAAAQQKFKDATAKRPAVACSVPPAVNKPYPHTNVMKGGASTAAYDAETPYGALSFFKTETAADGWRVGVETAAVRTRVTTYEGDLCNPAKRSDLETAVGSGEARLGVLPGRSGSRYGLGASGGIGVSALSVSGVSEHNFDLPFRDWSVSVRAKGGMEAAAVGAGAGGYGYFDADEKRAHLKGFLNVEALKGFNLGFDISIGKKYGTTERSRIDE